MTLIAVTGWSQKMDRYRSKEAGFDHHVVKPVNPTALLHLLEQAVLSQQKRHLTNYQTG
ncbi:MAG TPA: hypothetical protein VNM22_04310 [Candidatus Limnocylindrales bacterium]|nr:hypothetical protein [Candidatus Limnocylindrales bacterium]